MNGITILYQETAPSSLGSLQIILMVTGISLAVASLIMLISSEYSRHDDALVNASLATIIISLVLIGATGVTVCIPSLYEQKTQYYVTISDEVGYKEFIEKYEVIERKGDIYIVEENLTASTDNPELLEENK